MNSAHSIQLTKEGIKVDSQFDVLICASLFYFRIPENEWEDRIIKISEAGYNCLDVYFPWNYHEIKEDYWIFDGNRDIKKFLDIVKKYNLYVIARPGPYICSEWDLGGLPSYLLVKEDIRLRDNNKVFIRYVEKWFDKIIPIIADYQITKNGPIIALQVENELDFFNCQDRNGYLNSLINIIEKYDIEIPLLACSGQGDVEGATALLDNLVPTFNFYPSIDDRYIEKKVIYYTNLVNERNLPLIITETGREHFLLKRLLGCGAKLVGAYNQVGGTNFELYNAINNWGNPLSFLSDDYDFNSLVSAFGEIREDEYKKAILLNNTVNSLGNVFSQAILEEMLHISVDNKKVISSAPYYIRLKNQGILIAISNVDHDDLETNINIDDNVFPKNSKIKIKPFTCKYILYNFGLAHLGIDGCIEFSSGELCLIENSGNELLMVFYTDCQAEVNLEIEGKFYNFSFSNDDIKTENIMLKNGKILKIIGLNEEEAINYLIDKQNRINTGKVKINENGLKKISLNNCKMSLINLRDEVEPNNLIFKGEKALFLEQADIYKHWGWYKLSYTFNNDELIEGIILDNASDILSVYINDDYIGTYIGDGSPLIIENPTIIPKGKIELLVKAEIWGHSNFDDIRKKSLHIHSLKGINGAAFIKNTVDISSNWLLYVNDNTIGVNTNIGAWLTTKKPSIESYLKDIYIDDCDKHYLLFKDINCKAMVFINDKFIGNADEYYHILDISKFINKNSINSIKVLLEKDYFNKSIGKVYLIKGFSNGYCTIYSEGKTLYQLSLNKKKTSSICEFPLFIQPPNKAFIYIKFETDHYKKAKMVLEGENIKITGIFKNIISGRALLLNEQNLIFKGGCKNILYIPLEWLKDSDNELVLLAEPINGKHDGTLKNIDIVYMD